MRSPLSLALAVILATPLAGQEPFEGVTFDPSLMVVPAQLVEVAPGVFVRELSPQTGPKLARSEIATLRLQAWLPDGTSMPESAGDITYRLGDGTMLEGWDEAVSGMAEGTRRQIVLTTRAYENGLHSVDPPSIVVFEVELVKIG